ncbi:MAG TPA: mechanosensitive ion channel family protein [Burkholderiaceae bacterium]|nr:mechanosensitive ion channel family protein [Burkholderiaceae bacterium]
MSTPSQKPRPSRPDTEPGKRKQPAVSPWPFFWCGLSVLLYVFHPHLHTLLPGVELEHLHNVAAVSLFYSFGWLMAHSFRAFVTRKGREKGRRRAPRLLSELVSVTLFTVATMLAIGVLIGKSSGGVLASSGLIIAILGFAIRNVLADVLSGIALGLEAPFRIGDWVEFDSVTTGRVIEIGWRTTRILTADDTYMILPNSQISRQMLTNYSAPRKIYQASVDVTLRLRVPVEQAKQLLKEAAARAQETTGMVETQKAMVRVSSYGVEGITYTVKYWVSNYAHDLECRDAMLAAIDATLRKHDALPLVEPVRLMLGKDKIVRGVSQEMA